MEKVVNINNVNISTVSVEIKTLKVGNKQVTQALFNQFQSRDIVSEDGVLKGVPWGLVKHKDGWHIVWQNGNTLYRCYYTYFNTSMNELNVNRQFTKNLDRMDDFIDDTKYKLLKEKHKENIKTMNYRVIRYTDEFIISNFTKEELGERTYEYHDGTICIKFPQHDSDKLTEKLLIQLEEHPEILKIKEKIKTMVSNFKESRDILDRLEQLFIAV